MRILGVRVDEYDMRESLEQIEAFLAAGHNNDGLLRQVVTINPEGVWLARQDAALAAIVEQAALVTPDGNGILWAAQRLGHPLRERVTGIDLLDEICARAAAKGWRIYLLGAQPGVAEAAAKTLCSRYPGLQIVGCENGYFRGRESAVVAAVAAALADVLFAALGMPFQEKWLYQNREALGCRLAVGVGGSFDVLAGAVRRAPALWQRLKLEWLWRLLAEPKRWRRALVIPKYMAAVRREAAAQRAGAQKNG